jgi:hypothetical protein
VINGINTANAVFYIGNSDLIDCTFVNTTPNESIFKISANAEIIGGGLSASWVPGSWLIELANGVACSLVMDGVDLSNMGTSCSLFYRTVGAGLVKCIVKNCKLPSNWSGTLLSGTPDTTIVDFRLSMYNCTGYRMWIATITGDIKSDTGVYVLGGAKDTAPLSWRMVSKNDSGLLTTFKYLSTDRILKWNSVVGRQISVSVEITHSAGSLLTDNEIWIDTYYLGSDNNVLSDLASDRLPSPLNTASSQSSSSISWTGAGTYKQKLSVLITPQEEGLIAVVVRLAKSNTTVYVDPKLYVTY